MNIQRNRDTVKRESPARKDMVRRDVAEMIRLRETSSICDTLKVCALTSYIVEKCFDARKGDIQPEDILTIL